MNQPERPCQVCGGTGRIRKTQGFFTLETPCDACPAGMAFQKHNYQRDESRVSSSGYVYILLMTAGILKIGHTRKHPEDRADEWGLRLLAYARAEDSADAERRVHTHLARYRKGAYELFEIGFQDAIRALEMVVGRPTILRKP
jgi:hypothetical protein